MQRSFPSVVRSTPTPRNEPALTDQRTPPSLRTLYVWHLAPYGVDAELIPTERCALIRASFAKPDVPGFLFDIPGEHPPDIHQDAVRRTISFTSTANSGGVPDNFATYYVLQFSEHWETFGMTELKNHSVGSCIFRPIPSHWMFASQPPLSPSNRRSTISIMSLAPALRKTFFNRGRTSGTTIFAA